MTYKALPMVHTAGCSRDNATELQPFSEQGERRPAGLVIPENRRQISHSQLISLPAKLVCAAGLLVVAICAVILIVTHVGQGEPPQEAEFRVLVMGGLTEDGLTNNVEEVSIGLCPDREYSPIPDLPQLLADITGGYLSSGAVLVCGKGEQSTLCFIFRSGSDKWESAGQLTGIRQHSAMGVVGDTAYLVGGSTSGVDASVARCDVYSDLDRTWVPCPGLPIPAQKHCVTSFDGQLYSTGGQPHGRAVYSLEPGLPQAEWRNSSLYMHPRYSHGCTVLPLQSGPHLLLAGGLAPDTGKCTHTELVSLTRRSHTLGDGQAECRSGAGLVEVGGRVLMAGGERSDGELPEDLLELDTASLTWHTATTGRLAQGRQGHLALRIPCHFHATKKPKFHKLLDMP